MAHLQPLAGGDNIQELGKVPGIRPPHDPLVMPDQQAPMPRKIFVNFVVSDLDKAKAFYAGLGFTFNPEFTNDEAACMVVNDDAFFMVHTPESMKRFTPKPPCNPSTHIAAMFGFSADSRAEVDAIAEKAVATGGTAVGEPQDYGFMYQRSFNDLDGHHWEVIWLDPAGLPAG